MLNGTGGTQNPLKIYRDAHVPKETEPKTVTNVYAMKVYAMNVFNTCLFMKAHQQIQGKAVSNLNFEGWVVGKSPKRAKEDCGLTEDK